MCFFCQHSPEKKHIYIGKKTSPYICKYCGWEPTYVRHLAQWTTDQWTADQWT
jgi:hypothetical protein